MGCHTWFYKNVGSGLDRDGLQNCIIHENFRMIRLAKEQGINNFTEATANYRNEIYFLINEERRRKKYRYKGINLKDRPSQQAVDIINKWNPPQSMAIPRRKFVKDQWYEELLGIQDLFRVADYPDLKLFSLQDTLKFINKRKKSTNLRKRLRASQIDMKRIRAFWNLYPNGMVEFG